jgi:hypothetical protein
LNISGCAFSILYANAGNQVARSYPRVVMATPDQVQHLMPVAITASSIEPLMMAAAINDPGDLGQMIFGTITARKADIELDPYLPRLPKTKHGAEARR